MAKNHSNQGGGYDGGDPDAEIRRHREEMEARERQQREDEARRAQQERDARGGK